MTKQQLKKYCEAEFDNIDAVISEIFIVAVPAKTEYSTAELAAIATFIHNFYNGIENILKRILIYEKNEIKESPTWHKHLLKSSADKGILSDELYNALSNYLSFRHFFIHSYGFSLRWDELRPLVDGIQSKLDLFKNSVNGYIDSLS